jgi:hypothetical protein
MTVEYDNFYSILEAKLENSRIEDLTNFSQESLGIISKAASNGAFNSGGTFSSVSQLLKNQIEVHGRTILRLLRETLSGFTMLINDNFVNEILSYCSKQFGFQKDALVQRMIEAPPYNNAMEEAHIKRIVEEQLAVIEGFFNQKSNLLSSEIKLCIRRVSMSGNNATIAPIINVSGNVEHIQVGNYNTVVINETHKTSILDAFNKIREKSSSISPEKFKEIEPLMADCEEELKNPAPNKTKIGAILGAVGSAVSTVASLGSAYLSIKMLSPVFGGPELP